MEQYIADVQIAVLDGALKKYKDLIDKGYDKKFEIYEKYVKAQIPDQINNFMATDKVDKYFKCAEYKSITCCKDCKYATCGIDCVRGTDCKSGKGTVPMDKCPKMEFEAAPLSADRIPNATYTLTDSDGFYKDLDETWGIDKDWIRFDKRQMRINNGCQYAGEKVKECIEKSFNYFYNYPLADSNKIKIYNPKTIIGDSFPKAMDTLERFRIMQIAATWDEQMVASDMVDASSLPAFSTEEAILSMEKIIEKADEIKKAEREAFILDFITGLLFFIPFVGEAAGLAGLTAVKTMARLIGGVGNVALTVYEVVKNPDNAFMAAFSYLAGAGIGRGGFRNAANSRRGISQKDYDSLGGVKVKLDKVENLRGMMCSI